MSSLIFKRTNLCQQYFPMDILNDRAQIRETEKLALASIKLFTKYMIYSKSLNFFMPLLPLIKDEDAVTLLCLTHKAIRKSHKNL